MPNGFDLDRIPGPVPPRPFHLLAVLEALGERGAARRTRGAPLDLRRPVRFAKLRFELLVRACQAFGGDRRSHDDSVERALLKLELYFARLVLRGPALSDGAVDLPNLL